MSPKNRPIDMPARRLSRLALLAAAACAPLALTLPGQAQSTPPPQPAPQVQPGAGETGAMLWQEGGCFDCHGNLAAGDGDPAYPAGPSLRSSRLDRDLLVATISCGRPGTGMPMNLAGAYTETPCYGLPLGEPPGVPLGANFTAEQIEALVDFLLEHVVGVRPITRENCAVFFGGNMNAPACLQY